MDGRQRSIRDSHHHSGHGGIVAKLRDRLRKHDDKDPEPKAALQARLEDAERAMEHLVPKPIPQPTGKDDTK